MKSTRVDIKPATWEMIIAEAADNDRAIAGAIHLDSGKVAILLDDDVLKALKDLDPDIDKAIVMACEKVRQDRKQFPDA